MVTELRGFPMTDGSTVPFYRLPHTLAQLNAALNTFATSNIIFDYQAGSPGNRLAEPYRTTFAAVIRENLQEGGNTLNYLTPRPAASMRFLLPNLTTPTGPTINHSPGTTEWFESGGYERMRSTASITPAGSWNATDVVRIRPFPGEGSSPFGGFGIVLPFVIVETSDGYGRRLDLQVFANIVGWQSLAVNRLSPLPSGMPDKTDTLASVLLKDLTKGPEDMARYNPRVGTSTVGAYVLNKSEVTEFMNDLWTTNAWEGFVNQFIGDGANALLGLYWYYGIAESVVLTSGKSFITLGNNKFGPSAKYSVAKNEFITYDFGSIAVPATYGDYRDWTLISYKLYLPFVGVIDLNPADVIGKTLYLKYQINLTDGSAVCMLATSPITGPDNSGNIFTTSASWGYDIPVKVDSIRDAMTLTGQIMANVLPAAIGGASVGMAAGRAAMGAAASARGVGGRAKDRLQNMAGDEGAALGGLGGGISSVSASSPVTASYSTGSLSPNANVMGDFEAKLVMYRHDDLTQAIEPIAGKPSAQIGPVSSFSGYLKADLVYNGGTLPMRRAGEIIAMLQEGIYV